MSTMIWMFPILLSVAIVLGTIRGETIHRIAFESGKSYLKLVLGMTALAVVLQILLYAIPRLA